MIGHAFFLLGGFEEYKKRCIESLWKTWEGLNPWVTHLSWFSSAIVPLFAVLPLFLDC